MAEKDIVEILMDEMGGKKKYNEFIKEIIKEIKELKEIAELAESLKPKPMYEFHTKTSSEIKEDDYVFLIGN